MTINNDAYYNTLSFVKNNYVFVAEHSSAKPFLKVIVFKKNNSECFTYALCFEEDRVSLGVFDPPPTPPT
jgi:hypothetical protein